MLAGTALLLIFAVFLRRRPGGINGRTTVLLAVTLISVGVLPQALQRPDSTHLAWVTCVSWPFSIVAVAEVVRRYRPAIDWRAALAAGAVVALAATYTFTALFTFRYYLLHAPRESRPGPERAARRTRRAPLLLRQPAGRRRPPAGGRRSRRPGAPGERLLVGPLDLRRTWYSDTVLYWMFPELDPATYYLEMDPGLANAEDSGLADDVASADWLLLTGLWAGWFEPNTSIEFGSDAPNEVVRDQFCEAGSYEGGLVVLYRKCA